jgi:hypothetical protein
MLAAVGVFLVLAVTIFLLLFQWNWLRRPLASYLSGQLHRPVTIAGNLEVHPWSWTPSASAEAVTIGNPPWAPRGYVAHMPRVNAQIRLAPLLLNGKVELPLLEADHPDLRLLRDAQGRETWRDQAREHRPTRLPPINHLIITQGHVAYDDVRKRLHFTGIISSSEEVVGPGHGEFHFTGAGTLNRAPFTAEARGGQLVHVDTSRPYPFGLSLRSGPTQILAQGQIDRPFDFAGMRGRLSVRGPDFADLYPLTGLALPNTPPYSLTGAFTRDERRYAFRRFHGRVGDSDLAGTMSVDDTTRRPFVRADLVSRRLRLADLTAVIGGAPKRLAGHTVSPLQVKAAMRLAAEHRMLPDTRLDYGRIRAADARLTYRAASVDAGKAPIRNLALKLRLDRGLLIIDPLAAGLPQGNLTGLVRLDARRATPVTTIDLALRNARVEQLVRGGAVPPIEGGLYARARLTGTGDSVRKAAGSSNGTLDLVMPGGQIRKTVAELMGVDASKTLLLLINKNKGQTPVRCAVADFNAHGGVLTTRTLLIDTSVVQAHGAGDIDLRDETMAFKLYGKNKKFRLIRLAAPITIKGSLTSPKFGVDIDNAAPQAAASVALGALLSPLAAILPFIGPGLAKDADCGAVTAEARAHGTPMRVAMRGR